MPRITKKGTAGIIGGVRSPMATPNHGLVGSTTSMRNRGIDNATSHKSAASGGKGGIKTPYGKKNLV